MVRHAHVISLYIVFSGLNLYLSLTLYTENENKEVKALLEWHIVARKMAWDVVLLLGGGFALAIGCSVSVLGHQTRGFLSRGGGR